MTSVIRRLQPTQRTWQSIQFVSLALVLVCGMVIVVPNMWIPAWQDSGLVYRAVETGLEPVHLANHTAVYSLLLGTFLGFSFLWLLDAFKYYPGLILWLGIVTAIILFLNGWSEPLSSKLATGFLTLSVGVLLALETELDLITWIRDDKPRLLNPRRLERRYEIGVRMVLIMLSGLVLIGFADQHVAFQDSLISIKNGSAIPTHLLGSLGVLGPVLWFQQYRDTERIIQLGPAKSGKTSVQGGLYMSADESYIKTSGPLEYIHSEYMQDGEFPPRTKLHSNSKETIRIKDEDESKEKTALIIQFSYMTENLIFPKEKEITTVDYPGEILTGGPDGDGVATYIEKLDDKRDWESAKSTLLGRGMSEFDPEELKAEIAVLVKNSDVIMFTVPLDDFVTPIAANRRDCLPDYHTNAYNVYEIEDYNGPGNSEDKIAYRAKLLNSDDWINMVKRNGQITVKNQNKTLPIPLDPDEWLGNGGSQLYKSVDRVHPREYLREYHDIVNNALNDLTQHEFIWLTTKADLVLDDFKQVSDRASGAKLSSTSARSGLKIKCDNPDSVNEIEVGQSAIKNNIEYITNNRKKIRNKDLIPRSKADDYRVFAEWILNEYLCAEETRLEQWIRQDTPGEVFVLPLWFDIKDNEQERFDSSEKPILAGSDRLMSRLRGDRIKRQYPDDSMDLIGRVIKRKLPLVDSETEPLSYSEMLYEILKNIKEDND